MPQMLKDLRECTIGMLAAGMYTRAVAHVLNVYFSIISRLQRRLRDFGSTSNQAHNRSGRPCVTTPTHDIHIQHVHLHDSLWPATLTATETIGLHYQEISPQTVINHLRIAHLYAPCPHQGLHLTLVYHHGRLQWANAHISWFLALWGRFSLHGGIAKQNFWIVVEKLDFGFILLEYFLPLVWCFSRVACGKLWIRLCMDISKTWVSSINARFVQ